MKLTGNTIFITGGTSGIGRALAEALHAKGNKVIIAGRRKNLLDEVTAANPGMDGFELDVEDAGSISKTAAAVIAKYPALNVVINNAGIMKADGVDKPVDDATVTSIIQTNMIAPIRVTSAFLEQLKSQPDSAVAYVTSGLAFTPLAMTATYSATKAAMHSFANSQRYLLRGTSVKVLEIAPPWVQTELMGPQQAVEPRAMPLKDFIAETMEQLGTDAHEVLVERVKFLRNGAGPDDYAFAEKFNDMMAGDH